MSLSYRFVDKPTLKWPPTTRKLKKLTGLLLAWANEKTTPLTTTGSHNWSFFEEGVK